MHKTDNNKAPRNRSLIILEEEEQVLRKELLRLTGRCSLDEVSDSTICQDAFEVLKWLPEHSIELLFADPPYNLTKSFNGRTFCQIDLDEYETWLNSWISDVPRVLN